MLGSITMKKTGGKFLQHCWRITQQSIGSIELKFLMTVLLLREQAFSNIQLHLEQLNICSKSLTTFPGKPQLINLFTLIKCLVVKKAMNPTESLWFDSCCHCTVILVLNRKNLTNLLISNWEMRSFRWCATSASKIATTKLQQFLLSGTIQEDQEVICCSVKCSI